MISSLIFLSPMSVEFLTVAFPGYTICTFESLQLKHVFRLLFCLWLSLLNIFVRIAR